MSFNGRSNGKVEYMNKKIPRNAKYQHIKTKLDTGSSLTKYMEKLEDIKKNCLYRKDEIFKRLKVTTFAQLILQVASVSDLSGSENDGESHVPEDGLSVASDTDLESLSEHTNESPGDGGGAGEGCHSARSTLLSVINGVGELNLHQSGERRLGVCESSPELAGRPYLDCPYLLLDVRDRELYDCCHIVSAHSFPISMLARTINPYSKDVLEYKNAEGKIIIVYDEDERIASQAATIMCQRGFENLFMLSGGLRIVARKFPEGMTTGSIPASCLPSPTLPRRKRCPLLQQPPQAAEKKWWFTSDMLAKIQDQLEEMVITSNSTSRVSSRSSASSGQSKRSSALSRMGSSTFRSDSSSIQSSRPWK
ncbi:centrosomal protein of 41 kDa [Aulostomus maculatus]